MLYSLPSGGRQLAISLLKSDAIRSDAEFPEGFTEGCGEGVGITGIGAGLPVPGVYPDKNESSRE